MDGIVIFFSFSKSYGFKKKELNIKDKPISYLNSFKKIIHNLFILY